MICQKEQEECNKSSCFFIYKYRVLEIKNEIMYNYNFKNPIIQKNKNHYIIKEKGKIYNLYECADTNKLEEIHDLINTSPIFFQKRYKIIRNNYNKLWSQFSTKKIFIVEYDPKIKNNLFEILNEKIIITKRYNFIVQNNWKEIWQTRDDIIEKISKSKTTKKKEFNELIDYLFYTAESAIMYVKNEQPDNYNFVVSYKKIDEISMNNPLNIIIDNAERNIANQIKRILHEKNNNNKITEVKKIISTCSNYKISYNKVFARIMYPSEYFEQLFYIMEYNDIYDINEKILDITKDIIEYENSIKKTYYILANKKNIKNVDWL